MKIILLKF